MYELILGIVAGLIATCLLSYWQFKKSTAGYRVDKAWTLGNILLMGVFATMFTFNFWAG